MFDSCNYQAMDAGILVRGDSIEGEAVQKGMAQIALPSSGFDSALAVGNIAVGLEVADTGKHIDCDTSAVRPFATAAQ